MPTRLIINADDFGLTPGINRAVAELHAAGAVTSATLMAGGTAFEHAVSVSHAHPSLGVGCHVLLTDGVPVSDARSIPTLLGKGGRSFRPKLSEFLLAVLSGRVRGEEIEREALAQIERLQRAGIALTHLDTHKHTHMLPGVSRPLLAAAERAGVPAVRNPFEKHWSLEVSHSPMLRYLQVQLSRSLRKRFAALPQIRSGRINTTDGTVGISATGNLDAENLQKILEAMPEGTWELVCHPGYNDSDLDSVTTRLRGTREVEYRALLKAFSGQPKHSLPIKLVNYGSLSGGTI
jgi:chitin disaccharide deacetylase